MTFWLLTTSSLCCRGETAVLNSPSVAVCIIGDARTFHLTRMHIYTRLVGTGVAIDWFFWMTNIGYKNSKGDAYTVMSDCDLRADVAYFRPTFVELNATSSLERPKHCIWPLRNHLFDKSGETDEQRLVATEIKFRDCFRRVVAEERRRGRNYTTVVRMRPDIFFFANIDPVILTSQVPIFPNGGHGTLFPAFNGHLAFLPRWAAADYFNIVETYFHCNGTMNATILEVQEYPVYLNEVRWNHTARTVLIPYGLVRDQNLWHKSNLERTNTGCGRAHIIFRTNHGREATSFLPSNHTVARRNVQICLDAGGVYGDPTQDVPYNPDPDHIVAPKLVPQYDWSQRHDQSRYSK